MKIGGKQQNQDSKFQPCPEGDVPAVLVDIIDLGLVDTNYDGKPKKQDMVRFVFEAHPKGESETYLVFSRYTKSMHEKSNLRKHLKQWRGKDLSEKEIAEGYDIDLLFEKPVRLSISHNPGSDGTVYANIDLLRPLKGETCDPAGTYKPSDKYTAKESLHLRKQIEAAKAGTKKPLPNTPENNPAGIEDGPAF
jgi:hypothetical protein